MPTIINRLERALMAEDAARIKCLKDRIAVMLVEIQELQERLDGESSRMMFKTARPLGRLE